MNSFTRYVSSFFRGLGSLLTGMKITLRNFFRPGTTECYPENRAELQIFDRYCGELTMPHNENNQHKCVACGLCQMNCPNGSIKLTTKTETDENGKNSKVLVKYEYDLGSCIFCRLCVRGCPHDAITFDRHFENALFTRDKLVRTLNHEGSTVEKKR